jgi:uncharacterized RDD family membrane protein YckC
MKRAGFFTRFMAFALDLFIIFIVSMIILTAVTVGYIIGYGHYSFRSILDGMGIILTVSIISSVFLFFFYFTYLTGKRGSTIGKGIFSIKVVRINDVNIDLSVSFLRCLSYILSASIFFMGFLMALICRGRALHDFIANTHVIEDVQ